MNKNLFVLAILISTLLLGGCITKEKVYVNRYEDVPLIVRGEPVNPPVIGKEIREEANNLPIYFLTEDSTNEETVFAYARSVIILRNYAQQLEEAIRPFEQADSKEQE